MDLQAAENAHKVEKKEEVKSWNCPCNGCAKAVKQERKRILDELNKIELHDQHQTNAIGLKILMQEIIDPKVKK
jgi:hypothetical protein